MALRWLLLINFSLTFAYKEGNVKEMFEEYLKLSGRKNPLYIAGSLDDKSLLQKEVFERPDIDPEAHSNLPELLAELRKIDAFINIGRSPTTRSTHQYFESCVWRKFNDTIVLSNDNFPIIV